MSPFAGVVFIWVACSAVVQGVEVATDEEGTRDSSIDLNSGDAIEAADHSSKHGIMRAEVSGPPGPPGPPGPSGTSGLVIVGQHGPPGEYGAPGLTGPPGQKGAEGKAGLSVIGRGGPQGEHGKSGPLGRQGQPGTQGYMGPRGPPGDQPVHAEAWEKVLDEYESRLSNMERVGGLDKHKMAQDVGLLYQQVALYDARSTLMKNATTDLATFLQDNHRKITGSLAVAGGLHDVAIKMGGHASRKDLNEAERLMPVMLGGSRAIHSMQARQHQQQHHPQQSSWGFGSESSEESTKGGSNRVASQSGIVMLTLLVFATLRA